MRMRSLLFGLVLALTAAAASARTYDLVVERRQVEVEPGRKDWAIVLNGAVPGPVLRFTDGETAEIRVTNRLKSTAAIHWHGLLLDAKEDGAPGFNGFMGIAPGTTYTYKFKLRQSGTYWYHAHSATQEQAGQYGALVIAPKVPDEAVDREYVVLLSEHTRTDPERILRNLKGDAGYYNFSKRTTPEFFRDVSKFGLKRTLADRRAWGAMRMDPTDIADVGDYTLLVNGQTSARRPEFRFTPGERVRLRIINGSAMSFMDVRLPGLTMTVVAADGRAVEPVEVDEFRIGVAETYDVLVTPKDDRAYALWVETLDRRASVLAALTPRPGLAVAAPAPRPRQVLLMSEMGHTMLAAAPGTAGTPACTPEHAAMGHCAMPANPASATPAPKPACTPEHAAMGHCTMPAAPAPKPACTPEHAAMGHCTMPAPGAVGAAGAVRTGSAVAAAARAPGGTPYPKVDYGFGADAMAGMDHSGHGAMTMPALAREGDVDGSGRVFGWATGAPHGARVLSLRDLRAATPDRDARAPTREIVIRIAGNMERYIWTLNGAKFGEAPPIRVRFGERVRVTFVNTTMMAHPMHLHGMFFAVENGQPLDRLPEKNVVAVAPGRTQSIILTATEAGEWPLHCHLLYHMETGMMQKLIVAAVDRPDGTPVPATAGMAHAGHMIR